MSNGIDVITVKNKLEVKASGYVQIPGCEPISSLSSLRLAQQFYCKQSMIKVEDLLRCIPGAKLVRVMTPLGHMATGWFVELPSGPPPDGDQCGCNPDWYQIMKDCVSETPPSLMPECADINNYDPCKIDIDPFKASRDPNARPNSTPLGPISPFGYVGLPIT